MNVDLLALAITAKLLGVLAEEADESALKIAISEFPSAIRSVLAEVMEPKPGGGDAR